MVNDYKNIFWTGRCDVFILEYTTNLLTGRSKPSEVPLYQGKRCHLSFKTLSPAVSSNEAMQASQKTTLFISSSLEIPPSSKIVITQNGKTSSYSNSGEPAIYSGHQEIILEKFKEWT